MSGFRVKIPKKNSGGQFQVLDENTYEIPVEDRFLHFFMHVNLDFLMFGLFFNRF